MQRSQPRKRKSDIVSTGASRPRGKLIAIKAKRGPKKAELSVDRPIPLYDQIYEILWSRILNAEVPPGARLRDVKWAEELNVSRTPVREALRKMQTDGILKAVGHGRFVLKQIDSEELRSLYRCRAVLEALAVRDLKDSFSSSHVKVLTDILNRADGCMDQCDFRHTFDLNTEFHQCLLELGGNPNLLRLLKSIARVILYARASLRHAIENDADLTLLYAQHLKRAQVHHRKIVAAIRARNFEKAATQMEEHLFETAEDMHSILRKVISDVN